MYGFRGKIYATHATVAVMRLTLGDFIKVSGASVSSATANSALDGTPSIASFDREADLGLYDEIDVARCLSKIEPVDLKQRVTHNGITFTLHNAGHVLGAAMVLMEISSVKILYTGDYSGERDRHLPGAQPPKGVRPDVLICEATTGVSVHEPRLERERKLIESVEDILHSGGRCLIPISALGVAQELMLILEDHWERNPRLASRFPIYFASHMAERAISVYRANLGSMAPELQLQALARNPWDFKHIRPIRPNSFRDDGPCVVLAAPGMLQSGFSRELFDRWAVSPDNGVVLAGYAVDGTLARQLESHPLELKTETGRRILRKCKISRVSFHAHADSAHTTAFVDTLKPGAIVLVHGERGEMRRLRDALARRYDGFTGWSGAYMPGNNDFFRMSFPEARAIRVVGQLADKIATGGNGVHVEGVLVTRDFETLLCRPNELAKFTEKRIAKFSARQTLHIPFRSSFSLMLSFLGAMFGRVAQGTEDPRYLQPGVLKPRKVVVIGKDLVRVIHNPPDRVILTWKTSPQADVIADAIVGLLAQAEVSQLAIAATSNKCSHSHHAHPSKTPVASGVGSFGDEEDDYEADKKEGELLKEEVVDTSAGVGIKKEEPVAESSEGTAINTEEVPPASKAKKTSKRRKIDATGTNVAESRGAGESMDQDTASSHESGAEIKEEHKEEELQPRNAGVEVIRAVADMDEKELYSLPWVRFLLNRGSVVSTEADSEFVTPDTVATSNSLSSRLKELLYEMLDRQYCGNLVQMNDVPEENGWNIQIHLDGYVFEVAYTIDSAKKSSTFYIRTCPGVQSTMDAALTNIFNALSRMCIHADRLLKPVFPDSQQVSIMIEN